MSVKPFEQDELEVLGTYPVVESDFMTIPGVFQTKLNTPITPKENWRRFFNREDPLWVPDGTYDFNFLSPAVIPDNQACSFEGGYDSFGVKWIPDSNPSLPAFVEPGFTLIDDISDWEDLEWPDAESWAWDEAKDEYKVLDPSRPNTVFLATGLFERLISVMGFENAAVSFLLDPDSTHAFIDKLVDHNLAVIEHLRNDLNCDLLIFSDDWGSQKAPFFSKAIVEEFLAPAMEKMVKRTHELGMYFMHHCCGNVIDFIPYMIDEGVDSWEFNHGAVKKYLPDAFEKYGDKIRFDGYFGFLNPLPADEEIFKARTNDYYQTYGTTGKCSVTIYDYNEWDFDSRAYCYEVARKTYAGQALE